MPPANTPSLDNFDRNILRIMQASNRTTSEQIADQVGPFCRRCAAQGETDA